MKRRMLRLAGFVTAPVLGAVSPLLVIPVVTARFGAQGWAAVAVALSVGGAAAVIAELGWGVTGPQQLGRDEGRAAQLYERSLASRIVAVSVLLPVAVVVAVALAPAHRGAAGVLAAAATLSALSPAWFLVGRGRPWTLVAVDALPRCVATAAAALAIAAGAPLVVHGTALLLAAAATYVVSGRLADATARPGAAAFRSVGSVVREQSSLVVARGVSTAYTTLPAAVLASIAPGTVPAFAAVDRLARMGLTVLGAVPSQMQRWLGHPNAGVRAVRIPRAMAINAAVGVVAALAFLLVAPTAVELLFSGAVDVEPALLVATAALVAVICTSRGVGLALVAVGRAPRITTAVVIAAPAGVVALAAGALLWGAPGAASGLVAAEVLGLCVQLAGLRLRSR